jgi:O-antigen ligase
MLKLLLFLGIFTIPFSFDYSLYSVPMQEHSGWANGFMITLSDLFFLALFIVWKIQYVAYGKEKKKVYFLFPIFLFLGACLISLIGSTWRLFSYFEIIQYCKIVFLYFYVPLMVLQDEEDMQLVCSALLATLAFQSVLAIAQFSFQDFHNFMRTGTPVKPTHFGDYIRSHGTVGQPNAFAAFILPMLILAQTRLLFSEERVNGVLVGITLTGLTALIFSFSRAGWVGFLLALFFLLFLRRKGIDLARPIWLIIISLVMFLFFSDYLSARLTSDDMGASRDRWYLIQIAGEIIKSNFFTGVGINNYWFAMNHYIPPTYDWPFVYLVHNVFLLGFAETGIIGFISILMLFVIPIVQMYRLYLTGGETLSPYALWLCLAFLIMGIMNLVDLTWAAPILNSLYFLLLAMAAFILNLDSQLGEESAD